MFYKATTKKKILEDKWETINYIQHNQVCERCQQQNNESSTFLLFKTFTHGPCLLYLHCATSETKVD